MLELCDGFLFRPLPPCAIQCASGERGQSDADVVMRSATCSIVEPSEGQLIIVCSESNLKYERRKTSRLVQCEWIGEDVCEALAGMLCCEGDDGGNNLSQRVFVGEGSKRRELQQGIANCLPRDSAEPRTCSDKF